MKASNLNSNENMFVKAANAIKWLRKQDGTKILIKQTRNLGDTLHITPIARHYKIKFPDCKIAFLVGNNYKNAHEFNPDFDKIFPISGKLDPQQRIALGKYLVNHREGIDLVLCPSIFPFSEVWPSHKWSYEVISHQYRHNAKIRPPNTMLGDKLLHAPISKDDIKFANNFIKHPKCIALEYHSYSHPVPFKPNQFAKFVELVNKKGWRVISLAGANEGIIDGTIDGRGVSWRRSIAILSRCKYMIGIGSGVTMLACCANPMPKIIEINVSSSLSMQNCGYSNTSVVVKNPTPQSLAKMIL